MAVLTTSQGEHLFLQTTLTEPVVALMLLWKDGDGKVLGEGLFLPNKKDR